MHSRNISERMDKVPLIPPSLLPVPWTTHLFWFSFCVLCPLLQVSLCCLFLIVASGFSNVYLFTALPPCELWSFPFFIYSSKYRFKYSCLLCVLVSRFRPHDSRYPLSSSQALVAFKKYMSPPLPYFKVNICPFPLPHFASIFFAYLWSFRWPNYIVTLPRYFSLRLPHLNITTGPHSGELDKNIERT